MPLQPIWSAYRAAAYGSGLLTIYNTTHARWHWNGFIRNNVNAAGYTDGEPEVRLWRPPIERNVPAAHHHPKPEFALSYPSRACSELLPGLGVGLVDRNCVRIDIVGLGLQIFTAETIYMTRCDKPAISATVPKK